MSETFDQRRAIAREWSFSEDDHFSSGTAAGPNTRRDHALLSWKDEDGVSWVLVNHLEEWISLSGRNYPLSSTVYFDHNASGNVTIFPAGYKLITDFTDDPFPTWTFDVGGHEVRREVLPARGGGILVQYTIDSINGGGVHLNVRPMISARKSSDLHFENRTMNLEADYRTPDFTLTPYPGISGIHIRHSKGASYSHKPLWYRRVRLINSPRDEESLFSPGEFVFPLSPEKPSYLKLEKL